MWIYEFFRFGAPTYKSRLCKTNDYFQRPATGGNFEEEIEGSALQVKLQKLLGRDVLIEGPVSKPISKLAWCTGGGQGFIEQAVELGVDAFITGEVSEQTVHTAREMGITFFAAGHHATERYGVKSLGEHIGQQFDVPVEFIDIDNPA